MTNVISWFQRFFHLQPSGSVGRLPQLFLTNTLSGKKELFVPIRPGQVLLYSCGPTVYGPAHLGNLRAYVFSDTLARTLETAGYHVRRVINITDVGHLVNDAEEGEDKMVVGARREGLSPTAIADRYEKEFLNDLAALNIAIDDIRFPRATAYISEQVALAKTLEEKGFAYRLADGLYFDTQKFPRYGMLGRHEVVPLEGLARVAPAAGKHRMTDFALWRSAKPDDLQQWDSPWGRGNPGWHLECSAMIRALLGQEIDIHTGGEDHISIHHNNEIAQSEAASGRTFVHYWMHGAFLTMSGEKASKSLGNVVYLSDVEAHGVQPLALRYFFLQAHYRTQLSFSWDALGAAASALDRLWTHASDIAAESGRVGLRSDALNRFLAVMRDDLATPQALGILWEFLRSEEYSPKEKWGLLESADAHLGLSLTHPPVASRLPQVDLPDDVRVLLERRRTARTTKEYVLADQLRAEIEGQGYQVDDGPEGEVVTRSAF